MMKIGHTPLRFGVPFALITTFNIEQKNAGADLSGIVSVKNSQMDLNIDPGVLPDFIAEAILEGVSDAEE